MPSAKNIVFFEVGYLFNNQRPSIREIRQQTLKTNKIFLNAFFDAFSQMGISSIKNYDFVLIRKKKEKENDYIFQFYPRLEYGLQELEMESNLLDAIEVNLRKRLEMDTTKKGLIHVETIQKNLQTI